MKRAALVSILAVLALWAWCPTAGAAGGMLTFAPTAEVDAGPVTLMDLVAEGVSLDAATRGRLEASLVMPPLKPGQKARLDGRRLRHLVASAGLSRSVSVLIPAHVTVTRARNLVTRRALEQAYIQALRQRLGSGMQVDVHHITAAEQIKVPAGRVSLKVRFISNRLMGRVPAVVNIQVDGRTVAQSRVVAQVDVYGDLVVAARALGRHHVIGPDDLKVIKANLSRAGKAAASDPRELIGLRTSGRVAMGQPIDPRRLERAPLIKRGEVVTMVVRAGGLKVTAKGKATQTGYLGGRIKLINLASRRHVYGKVLPNGRVLVEF